jgi:hypothetical protein
MPVLQKTYEKYKDGGRVALITINSRDDTGSLKRFLSKHRYSLPVLLEGEYVANVGVDTFPTTWFMDQEGRIAFVKVGRMDELDLEWRLQALLETKDADRSGKKD